ncbi:glycoside hydrolase family 95 protein, partial [Bacteroidales bacterium OttesenSCG-928-L03]|nr:glycoside hydrolase family 95 protein [Bacteroidales bacterium OttesenSCG-928-L03]
MKKTYLLILTLLTLASVQAQENLKLWYDKPAADWNAALPLGNGRLGAMFFGAPAVEQLQLNEETIWAGSPNSNAHKLEPGVLDQVRKLVFEGRYLEAQDLATAKIMSRTNHGMPYQTMGDLFISFPGHENYSDYYRELDINRALGTVTYTSNGIRYKREIFTSFTDQAIIVRLTADQPQSISCNVFLTTPQEKVERFMDDKCLILTGLTPAHEKQSGKVQFETRVKPQVQGGSLRIQDNIISIEKADEAILYIAIATNFVNYQDITGDKTQKCQTQIDQASSRDYDQALAAHTAFFQEYMNRVTLNLGTSEAINKPTDTRIRDFAETYDPQLAALYFQFGRYLLICSSQPGTQAANLQGIWNDRYLPSWDSKYTCNINLEMNYWPSENGNLTELNEPLFSLVRDVSETGKHTASLMYNTRGWVLHHNTDIWRITGPVDRAPSGMWPSGGAWLCQHLWEHFLYTGDKAFLAEAYPIMKGAAEFFMDFMIQDPNTGYLVVVPSNSPENAHSGSNKKSTTASGCTMDNQLVFDLYSNLINASRVLGIDQALADSLHLLRSQLSPMQIGQHGQLQEWQFDWDDPNDKHRHVSHLYGAFPSNQISPYRTPELFEAA